MQKINEGDTGAMAANKIYKNDKKLLAAVNALKDYLDSYGALITITASGGSITLVSTPGDSTTSVMNQKAVTDFVNTEVDNMCKVGQTIEHGIQMPSTGSFSDAWVSRASMNAQGNSLTILYNDVQELKELKNTIANMQSAINSLNDRVTTLESKVAGY